MPFPNALNNHVSFLGAIAGLAGQENIIDLGDQEYRGGFYKTPYELRMVFPLVELVLSRC